MNFNTLVYTYGKSSFSVIYTNDNFQNLIKYTFIGTEILYIYIYICLFIDILKSFCPKVLYEDWMTIVPESGAHKSCISSDIMFPTLYVDS